MLSKKEIIAELENRRAVAANRACQDVAARIAEEKARIIQDLRLEETADEIEADIQAILNKVNTFKEVAKAKGCPVHEGYYGSIGYELNSVSRNVKTILESREITISSKKLKELESEASVIRSAVTSEWNKVLQNCMGLSKNRDLVKYLVSIGFNEADFNPECVGTSLMISVNTALLCREVVKNEMD